VSSRFLLSRTFRLNRHRHEGLVFLLLGFDTMRSPLRTS
jgi:hypothetical protein